MTPWYYVQATGELIAPDGEIFGGGYSGRGVGRNNPAMQHVPNMGPIPCGDYFIAAPVDTPEHGPFVLRLAPASANQMFGRDGFLMHGDNVEHDASEGCIIEPRPVRKLVATLRSAGLRVVASHEQIPQKA